MAAHHAVDPRRHGRREQRGLPVLRSFAQYQLDVLGEAHVKHLVGLVEHDDLKAAQVQRSPGDVVERAPGRRHHDVDATVKRTQLPADRLPAVDRQHPHAHVAPVAVHRLGDLYRELARGHEDQGEHPRLPAPAGDPLEHGKREGGRLARPRRGLPDQVTARDQRRDGSSLYWRRLLVAEARQRPAQSGGQPQLGEAAGIRRHCPRPMNNRLARKAPIHSRTGYIPGRAVERCPGRVPIQRGVDPRVTCHVLATALIPSSASVTADYRRNGPAASWRSSPRLTPRSCGPRALVSQGYGSRSCRSPVSALIRPGPSARGPVPGAASPGSEGKHATSFSASPQPTRTQDNHDREVQPIRRPIHSQPGISRTMTARQHPLHRDSPLARPSATGPGDAASAIPAGAGIEAVLERLKAQPLKAGHELAVHGLSGHIQQRGRPPQAQCPHRRGRCIRPLPDPQRQPRVPAHHLELVFAPRQSRLTRPVPISRPSRSRATRPPASCGQGISLSVNQSRVAHMPAKTRTRSLGP